jgi:hypothetical protein
MEIKKVNFTNVPGPAAAKRSNSTAKSATDGVSLSDSTALEGALASVPDSRPEAVQRAKDLLADPNYPPLVLIQKLSRLLATNTDTSIE